jgi:hypothetical protein
MSRTCLYCQSPIKGRADKKFCDADCRGAYHNHKKFRDSQLIKKVNLQLLENYRVLKECLVVKIGTVSETTVAKQLLKDRGFDPDYHTSRKILSGRVYYFTYDIGYTVINAKEVFLRMLPKDYTTQIENEQLNEPAIEYVF